MKGNTVVVMPDVEKSTLPQFKQVLLDPCVPGALAVRCRVEKDNTILGMSTTTFRCFLDVEGPQEMNFLISATKKTMAKTSYYLFSTDLNPSEREGDDILGKLRGSEDGHRFMIYDTGISPDKARTENLDAPALSRKVSSSFREYDLAITL